MVSSVPAEGVGLINPTTPAGPWPVTLFIVVLDQEPTSLLRLAKLQAFVKVVSVGLAMDTSFDLQHPQLSSSSETLAVLTGRE